MGGRLCKNLPDVDESSVRFIGPGPNFDVQGYVTQLPNSTGQCVLAFRGTQPGNHKNFDADIDIDSVPWPPDRSEEDASWCPGCRAHSGFSHAYEELRSG